jgi:hypothetical protein
MSKSRPPVPEPFDLALSELYKSTPRIEVYKRFLQLGVEIGDSLAQYAMATMYLNGDPRMKVRRNLRKAIALLEASAPFFNRAAYDLAVCKLRGEGTRRDLQAAYSLFVRAAHLGSLAALEEQANCLASGVGTERDPEAARLLSKRVSLWKRQLNAIPSLTLAVEHDGRRKVSLGHARPAKKPRQGLSRATGGRRRASR